MCTDLIDNGWPEQSFIKYTRKFTQIHYRWLRQVTVVGSSCEN